MFLLTITQLYGLYRLYFHILRELKNCKLLQFNADFIHIEVPLSGFAAQRHMNYRRPWPMR